VSRLRAADGISLGTFPVGAEPQFIAFDGENMWVTNMGTNNVTKLRNCDGALLGTFPVGNSPIGIAFDGANVWVNNHSANLANGSVSKL